MTRPDAPHRTVLLSGKWAVRGSVKRIGSKNIKAAVSTRNHGLYGKLTCRCPCLGVIAAAGNDECATSRCFPANAYIADLVDNVRYPEQQVLQWC